MTVQFHWNGGGKKVYLVGSFNKWDKTDTPMTKLRYVA